MLMEKVTVEYQKYQAKAQEAGFYATLMAAAMGSALKAVGMEPVPPPGSLRVGISLSALGKIEPTLLDDPSRQSGLLYIKLEDFEAISKRLKREIMKGMVTPKNEDEIPRLIFALASQLLEKSHGE